MFETDTDTEASCTSSPTSCRRASVPKRPCASALGRLQGAFALAIIFAGHDDLMIAARQGSPLAIGHGNGEMYLGSDAIALAPVHRRHHLSRRRRLGGADAATASRSSTAAANASSAPQIKSVASSLLVDKGNHRHFMAKEIHEQPEVISHTLANYIDMARSDASAFPTSASIRRALPRVTISACGTAYYAGLVGKYWIERYARMPVEIDVASEIRYREPPLAKGGLALFVSQSGETADTLATLRYCQGRSGQRIASVVNVRTSTIARESDAVLPTLAGPEIGVASTKAFTCQLVCARLPGAGPGARARQHRCATRSAELVQALIEVPRHISTILRNEQQYES